MTRLLSTVMSLESLTILSCLSCLRSRSLERAEWASNP